MIDEENTNQIDGQPVSEYGYLTYQFWKGERFRLIFSILIFALCGTAILSSGALLTASYLSHAQCEVHRGSTP